MPAPITPDMFEAIRGIVDVYHAHLVALLAGDEQLSQDMKDQVEALGLPEYGGPPLIHEAFDIGAIVAAVGDPGAEAMTYEDYEKRVHFRVTPLHPAEVSMMEVAAARAGEYCRGLGNRVNAATGQILIDADEDHRAWMEDQIRTTVAEAKQYRKTAGELRSDLGHATTNWTRDLQRIAATESNTAYQRGMKAHFKKEYGSESNVAKQPTPDACDDCKRLYYQNGKSGPLKIFKLSTLEGNSNVKVKRAGWEPTIESTHPWCQCTLVHIPDGWAFDEDGDLVPVD